MGTRRVRNRKSRKVRKSRRHLVKKGRSRRVGKKSRKMRRRRGGGDGSRLLFGGAWHWWHAPAPRDRLRHLHIQVESAKQPIEFHKKKIAETISALEAEMKKATNDDETENLVNVVAGEAADLEAINAGARVDANWLAENKMNAVNELKDWLTKNPELNDDEVRRHKKFENHNPGWDTIYTI